MSLIGNLVFFVLGGFLIFLGYVLGGILAPFGHVMRDIEYQ